MASVLRCSPLNRALNFTGVNVKKINELWDLLKAWLEKKLRSPFSNGITRSVLTIGALIVATPLVEHLLFNAILKQMFGIDLGIEVPDLNAYIFGSLLILAALGHNLLFIKLTHVHELKVADAKLSVYKELWSKIDSAADSTFKTTNLYCTKYSASDEQHALEAEEFVIDCLDFLRKNRPFFFSDTLYQLAIKMCSGCMEELKAFRACIQKKKELDDWINAGKNEYDFYQNNYDFGSAQKEARAENIDIKAKYDVLSEQIRKYREKI